MVEVIKLLCPKCGVEREYTVSEAEYALERARMDKMYRCAQQMADKKGPFYDRWVAAMALLGPRKRCKTCLYFQIDEPQVPDRYCTVKLKVVSGGCYACKHHAEYDRSQ